MIYYINLFSPETYRAFRDSNRTISGFSLNRQHLVAKVKAGDVIICYLTKLSRWCGLLEVVEDPFEENTPLFVTHNDPYILRFRVQPKVWLPLSHTVPIHTPLVWQTLSFTQHCDPNKSLWTIALRSSLNRLNQRDGIFLSTLLQKQQQQPVLYTLSDIEQKKLKVHTVNRVDKVVSVSVPEDDNFFSQPTLDPDNTSRESSKIQALLAYIGACMGMNIWIPKGDRG